MFTQDRPGYDLLQSCSFAAARSFWRRALARAIEIHLDRPMPSFSISAAEPGILLLLSHMLEKPELSGRISPTNASSGEREDHRPDATRRVKVAVSPMPFFEADALRLRFASAFFDW